MLWQYDIHVANWAKITMPQMPIMPLLQFSGNNLNFSSWVNGGWLNNPLLVALPNTSSPTNIIKCFSNNDWLAGVVLVTSWGNMRRTKASIMGAKIVTQTHRNLVSNAIQIAWNQIQASAALKANWTMNNAWNTLTLGGVNQLRWTSVMASKTLHFMTRAMGVTSNPPVPLDNAVTRKLLWPKFVCRVQCLRNQGYTFQQFATALLDRDFCAYKSYMTAIEIWAQRHSQESGHSWTTTDVETTLFSMLMRNPHLDWV